MRVHVRMAGAFILNRCYLLRLRRPRPRRAAGVSRGGTLGLGLYALKSGALESAQILKFSKVCHGIPFEDITSNILKKIQKPQTPVWRRSGDGMPRSKY